MQEIAAIAIVVSVIAMYAGVLFLWRMLKKRFGASAVDEIAVGSIFLACAIIFILGSIYGLYLVALSFVRQYLFLGA